jgi:hypothetical protein
MDICHINGQGEFRIITIAAPAYDAHIAPGDVPVDSYYPDEDGDEFGDESAAASDCPLDLTDVMSNTDCDDSDPDVNPDATEVERNGIDDDCNPDTPDVTDCPGGRLDEKCVFVTSQRYNGNLGGLTGADDQCQQLATDAGLNGIYRAWLSDSAGNSPNTRFTQATMPYRRTDGVSIAASYADLIDCTGGVNGDECLDAALRVTEHGISVGGVVFTGTGSNGLRLNGTCNGWTSNSARST